MTTKIHYDDNIFYLDSMVKTVKSGLSLDIDPEYFIDKVIEDILFLDSALLRTFASLKANFYLIKRVEHLRGLLRTDRNFLDLIDSVLERKFAFSSHLEPFFEKFRVSRSEHLAASGDMKRLLEESREESSHGEDIISPAEFHFLLKEDENREET